ncbi:RNA/RNP complex-1-interacting phosphatase isoform X3 [Prionailurus iriomotensis]
MVSNQLCAKYSQEYAQLCRTNEIGTVTSQSGSPGRRGQYWITEDVKKGAVDRAGGTLAGTGDPLEASPISALGPFPVRPPASCFLSLPPERQGSCSGTVGAGLAALTLLLLGGRHLGDYMSQYLIDVEGMRPDDAIELFNRCRGHCLERQNYIEDLQKGPIRRSWDSGVSRSSGFEAATHMMEPVHATIKSVNQGQRYNLHQTQGYPVPSWHFHSQTQDLQQSNDSYKKSDLCPPLFPSTGFNLPTSPKPESRSKMGFDNFMPPDLPDEKPQASLSIDPCGSEEVDFEDLNRRLEILKKTTKFLGLGLINCLGIRALQHKC